MGALPDAPLARGEVEVAGAMVAVRSLTRAEALALRAMAGEPDADARGEVYLIARGLDIGDDEARSWWESSDPVAVGKLVHGIGTVSRLIGEDGRDPNSPPSGPSSRGT